jgi:hypothetical protein
LMALSDMSESERINATVLSILHSNTHNII